MICLITFFACSCTPVSVPVDLSECIDTGMPRVYQVCPVGIPEPPKPDPVEVLTPKEHATREAERLNRELGSP